MCLGFVSQRSWCQSNNACAWYGSSLPSSLSGAGRHVVQRSPESCRYYSTVQDVQQHGSSSCGAGEDGVSLTLFIAITCFVCMLLINTNHVFLLRSEFPPFLTCSCSRCLSQDQRSTKTINTNTSTSWPMLPAWLRHGRRYMMMNVLIYLCWIQKKLFC